MRKFFLTAGPWKLFFALFVVPTSLEFFAFLQVEPTDIWPSYSFASDDSLINRFFNFVADSNVVYVPGFVIWAYIAGINLNRRVPKEMRRSALLFRIALVYGALYALIPLFVANVIDQQEILVLAPNWPQGLGLFSKFYALVFLGTNYAQATRGKKYQMPDRANPVFLFWFYLVGIWYLQPKIKKLFSKEFGSKDVFVTEAIS